MLDITCIIIAIDDVDYIYVFIKHTIDIYDGMPLEYKDPSWLENGPLVSKMAEK